MIKRVIRRILFLLMLFVLGVTGTALLLNSQTTDDRSDMNDPVLPEVMIRYGDNVANLMYGYRQEMQTDFMRDSVTPMDTTKELTFVVNPYDTAVSSLSYEIRTSDGSKVMENRKIKNLDTWGDYLQTTVTIDSSLLMNQEYSMRITLETDRGNADYYTRVISRSSLHVQQYVEFVRNFYEMCMNKTTADNLGTYLEPSDNPLATNFASLNINSTLSQISWGSLEPVMTLKGVPTIKDINETTASISIKYQVSARNADGDIELYNVEDFYRMRYTETRIMLLDMTRSASQVFQPRNIMISEEGLVLGVRDKNVVHMTNEDGTVLAFVQEGDLWSYSPDDGKMVRIYSFRRDEGSDSRDNRVAHEVKIIRVDAGGDVDFVLSGYMNRGDHEGMCGIGVFHYSVDQNVVEEKVFIPCTESPEFLSKDLGILSYVSLDNRLFLLFAEKLYQVDIEKGKYLVLDINIDSDNFVVSESNAHAAWIMTYGDHEGQIKEIDFDTGNVRYITPAGDQMLRTIGFMNEDLIYGALTSDDILMDSSGAWTEGMPSFVIEGFDGVVKKEYHQDGLYVMNVSIIGNMMEFELATKTASGYKVSGKDNIINNTKAASSLTTIELTSTSKTGIMVRLTLKNKPSTERALAIYAKMKIQKEREISLDTQVPDDNDYYVYANGGLFEITDSAAQAIHIANEQKGVVLNRDQQYIWERGNQKTSFRLNVEDVPQVFLDGTVDRQTIEEELGDRFELLDLTGGDLEEILYEISAQRAILAKTSDDTAVVIVGYDEYNTWLYHPDTGKTEPYGMNDSRALFGKAGNVFFSYLE